jgi:hypothetical protein
MTNTRKNNGKVDSWSGQYCCPGRYLDMGVGRAVLTLFFFPRVAVILGVGSLAAFLFVFTRLTRPSQVRSTLTSCCVIACVVPCVGLDSQRCPFMTWIGTWPSPCYIVINSCTWTSDLWRCSSMPKAPIMKYPAGASRHMLNESQTDSRYATTACIWSRVKSLMTPCITGAVRSTL